MADDKKDEKTVVKKKPSSKPAHTHYEVKGDSVTVKNKSCPKCGQGFFLAQHNNRLTCGKCGYVEMISKEKKE